MRVIGYCRVSTEEQVREGISLDTQKQELIRYCAAKGYELLNTYIDAGVSAYKIPLQDRPQGQFVVNHIFAGDVDGIVAISSDRLFRNLQDSICISNACKRHCVKIIYTRQDFRENIEADSLFLNDNLINIINEFYSLQYSKKVKKGLENKVRRGEWVGKSPFGYDLVNSHLIVNEEEARVIRLIFDLYVSKNWGSALICNHLNSLGIEPPKNSKYWSKTSVLCMLKNEVYTGTTIFNRRAPKNSGHKYNPRSEWIIAENTHPAIISQEDFDKAQQNLNRKRKDTGAKNIDRKKTGNSPLSGLLYCANCGGVYTYTSGISSSGKKIYYYQCNSRKKHGGYACNARMIPSVLLENYLLYVCKNVLTSDMFVEQFEAQLKIRLKTLEAKKKDINKIKGEISRLERQKEKLLNMLIDEDDSALINVYKEKLNVILESLNIQNNQLELYKNIDINSEEEFLRQQFSMSYDTISEKDFEELDREQLKVIFNKIIEKVDIEQFAFDNVETGVYLTVNLRIPGYAPKYALNNLKGLKTELEENRRRTVQTLNRSKNGGGEGLSRSISELFYISIQLFEEIKLHRGYPVDRLLEINSINNCIKGF